MKKNKKFLIFVGVLIVIIPLIIFVLSGGLKDIFKEEVELVETLSDEMWFRVKSATYSLDNELIHELDINDSRYLSFNEKQIVVCSALYDIECEYYDYAYDSRKQKLVISSDNKNGFIFPATYDVVINDDSFTLAREIEELDVIAAFTYMKPAG